MSTAANNGSAYAYTTTLPTGDFRLAFWLKASAGVISHTDFAQPFEIGYGSGNYVQLYSNGSDATPELHRWRNEAGDDQTVIADNLYVSQWIRIGLERTGTTWTLYYADVDDTSWTTLTSWTNANAWASLCLCSSYITLGSYTMPGASVRSARLYTANTMAQVLADTLSATPTLGSLWAAWFDGTTASLDGSDSSGNSRPLTVSGTFVSDGSDPIASGVLSVTGAATAIAVAAGVLANTPQAITGYGAGIATGYGSVNLLGLVSPPWFGQPLVKPRWFDRTLEREGWFSRYFAAAEPGTTPTGQTAGIATSAGALVPAGAQGLGGQGAALSAAAGSLFVPPDSLVGRILGIAAAAGGITPADLSTIAGQGAGIAASAGAPTPAGAHGPAGQALGLAVAFGSLATAGAYAVTGQAVAIAATSGALATPGGSVLTGQLATIATAAGLLGAGIGQPVTGQAAGIAGAAGTFGPGVALGVAGRFLGVAVSAGALGISDAVAVLGAALGVSAAAGAVTPPGVLAGQGANIAAAANSVAATTAALATGQGAGIATTIGNLGSTLAVIGSGASIAATHGTLAHTGSLALTGGFIGIGIAHGSPALPGAGTVRTPVGAQVNIASGFGLLTLVDYGPPVDAAVRYRGITDNAELERYAVARLWQWHTPTGETIPDTFPYVSHLRSKGYLMVRQIKAAFAAELVEAGLTPKQAQAVVTAASNL